MDLKDRVSDYDILGYKIRLSTESDDSNIGADEVVEMVRDHTDRIMNQCPNLDRGEVALLAALTIAKEKLSISSEYKENVAELQNTAHSALNLIEEVSPTTV